MTDTLLEQIKDASGWGDATINTQYVRDMESRIMRDADRIEELEAKLKDAMEEVSTYSNDPHLVKWARTTLAELKG